MEARKSEVVENGNKVFYSNVDPIADLLVFDPLGIILFKFDGVSEFFSEKLSLNDWSMQSAISFYPLSVRNVGQNFVMKYPLSPHPVRPVFCTIWRFRDAGTFV